MESTIFVAKTKSTHQLTTNSRILVAIGDIKSHSLPGLTSDLNDMKVDEEGFSVWLNERGDLETDLQDLGEDWDELSEVWAVQKVEFIENTKNGKVDWLAVNLNKHSTKCLRSAIFSRTHRWTKLNPGEFACSACTNMQKICFGDLNGRLEALPLPAQAIKREKPKMIHLFVVEGRTAMRDDYWSEQTRPMIPRAYPPSSLEQSEVNARIQMRTP